MKKLILCDNLPPVPKNEFSRLFAFLNDPFPTKKRKVLEFVGRVSLGLKLMQIQKNAEEKFHNNWLLLSVNLPRWRWIDIVTSNLFLHQSTAQQNVEFKNKIYQQKFRGNV